MESERKKRKMEENGERDRQEAAEEGGEEKIEKFFALIKSTRDIMHDYIHTKRSKEGKGKNIEQDKVAHVVWNPSFQPQDFMEQEFPNNKDAAQAEAAAATSGSKKEEEEEQQDKKKLEEQKEEQRGNDLDLKLSL